MAHTNGSDVGTRARKRPRTNENAAVARVEKKTSKSSTTRAKTTNRKVAVEDTNKASASAGPRIGVNEPQNITELAISGQKLKQLKQWFTEQFNEVPESSLSRFLLMKGPPGSAKTIALNIVAKEFGVKVVEVDPTMGTGMASKAHCDLLHEDGNIHSNNASDNRGYIQRRIDWLQRFIRDFRNNKRSLFEEDAPRRKILLFECITGVLFTKQEYINFLHDELREWASFDTGIPVVFIISEYNVETKLFPKEFQDDIQLQVMNFNPITENILAKSLTRIAKQCELSLSPSEVKEIAASAGGDIRSAMSHLIFDTKVRAESGSILKNLGHDESTTLVHAMAKVLYAKRLPEVDPSIVGFLDSHPNFPRKNLRNLLKEDDIESLFSRLQIDSRKSSEWIYENYTDFIRDDDLDTAIQCLDILSIADSHFDSFEHRDSLEPLRQSYLLRGQMYSLNCDSSAYPTTTSHSPAMKPPKVSKLHTLRGPTFFKRYREEAQFCDLLTSIKNCELFKSSFLVDNRTFILDILPYVASRFNREINLNIAKTNMYLAIEYLSLRSTNVHNTKEWKNVLRCANNHKLTLPLLIDAEDGDATTDNDPDYFIEDYEDSD